MNALILSDKEMNEQIITLAAFAEELGLDRSAARKAIKVLEQRSGRTFLQRGRVRDNQPGWVLTRDSANSVIDLRRSNGYLPGRQNGTCIVVPAGEPTTYVIRITALRLKIGYTESFEQRVTQHRTIAPDLEVLRRWRLPQAYEVVFMDIVAGADGMRRVGGEVFESNSAENLASALASIDELAARVKAVARD